MNTTTDITRAIETLDAETLNGIINEAIDAGELTDADRDQAHTAFDIVQILRNGDITEATMREADALLDTISGSPFWGIANEALDGYNESLAILAANGGE